MPSWNTSDFYPRSPCGERHIIPIRVCVTAPISIHALLAESDLAPQVVGVVLVISIHALLAESDWRAGPPTAGPAAISIHALLAESDLPGPRLCPSRGQFLSTLSLRRATFDDLQVPASVSFLSTLSLRRATFQGPGFVRHGVNFYPRSPCGERRGGRKALPCDCDFYPRSPCGERRFPVSAHRLDGGFLSTLSLRRATVLFCAPSIQPDHFYPRSPCGERRLTWWTALLQKNFYPRSPCGERQRQIEFERYSDISIHALLAESDHSGHSEPGRDLDFYPRSPCGERLPGA